jgi:hypothetical protein
MEKIMKVVNLVVEKYIDTITLIIEKDLLTIEYLYFINGEQDVYKTLQVIEENNKLKLKFLPERNEKIVELNDLENIFEILKKQSQNM